MAPPKGLPAGLQEIDYAALASARRPDAQTWDCFVREALVDRWLQFYEAITPWAADVLEFALEDLIYLFDAAPTRNEVGGPRASDRVVAVWGFSRTPHGERDRKRIAGFLPGPARWSGTLRDRGHFVAHEAGGGLDVNLFPQGRDLNRGWSRQGRRWRALERHAAAHPGTPLFVRPVYSPRSDTWVPAEIEYALLVHGELRCERFLNR